MYIVCSQPRKKGREEKKKKEKVNQSIERVTPHLVIGLFSFFPSSNLYHVDMYTNVYVRYSSFRTQHDQITISFLYFKLWNVC